VRARNIPLWRDGAALDPGCDNPTLVVAADRGCLILPLQFADFLNVRYVNALN